MKMYRVVPLVALCCLLLPAVASSQDPTGACWGGGEVDAYCIDGITESECLTLDFVGRPQWAITRACEELEVPFLWDGSCLIDYAPVGDDTCFLIWTAPGGEATSQEHCTTDGGDWSDDLMCGVPVPAMPKFTLALMAGILLGVALLILTVRGRVV